VGLAMSSDVLTIYCGACRGAPLLFSLPQISVLQIMGSQLIMVAGVIFPRSTLRCLRLHSLKLQHQVLTLCQCSTRGNKSNTEIEISLEFFSFPYFLFSNILQLQLGETLFMPNFVQGEVSKKWWTEIHFEWKFSLLSSSNYQCRFGW
jgi:hypothetical protein